MFSPTSSFYLYVYPILSSMFAGFIFWAIFSYFPERKRQRSIGLGVTDDLIKLNNHLFSHFDCFLRGSANSPSFFQHRIHACAITLDEFDSLLQNKTLDTSFHYYPQIVSKLIPIGKVLNENRAEIDEVIKRLYAFNIYLSTSQIHLLRSIHEKLFRYRFEAVATTSIGGVQYRAVDPSLSYMSQVLLELQTDYSSLRKFLFQRDLEEGSFVISQIQFFYNTNDFKRCVALCTKWINAHPYESDLHSAYKMSALLRLNETNRAYRELDSLVSKNCEIISLRQFFYPLLSDPTAHGILAKKVSREKIEEMRGIVESETLQSKTLLASNADLKAFYAAQRK